MPVLAALAPIMAVVLIGFVVVGMAMPVLPLYVHHTLGMSSLMVGLVAGSQFATSLVTRPWAGHYADTRGGKRAVLAGLIGASAAGALYLLSVNLASTPLVAALILLVGRAVLGGAESFIITGALGWGLSNVNADNTGKVIAWMGTAMYVAFAAGAPLGTLFYEVRGFAAIALATLLLPVASSLFVWRLKSLPPPPGRSAPAMRKVFNAVLWPGVGLALSSFGFGAMTTFLAILFSSREWTPAWPAFTGFAAAFIVARLFLGHLPDRLGGARVALLFVFIEAGGQALLWLAPSYSIALCGALLTGFGYSLVYPGFAVEAVKRAPPASKAFAMGAYTAFLDLALGLGSPVLGWIADRRGVESVFLVSALAVVSASLVALGLMRQPRPAIVVKRVPCAGNSEG